VTENALTSSDEICRLLLVEQRRQLPRDVLHLVNNIAAAGNSSAWSGAPHEAPLVAAAAAINLGEPKTAIACLNAIALPEVLTPVSVALRYAATAYDLNWYPGNGGASTFSDPTLLMSTAIEFESLKPVDRNVQLIVAVAEMLPSVLTARYLAAHRGAGEARVDAAVKALYLLGHRVLALKRPDVLAYLAVTVGDVLWRGRRQGEANQQLDYAEQLGESDPIVVAHVAMVRGDWAAEPIGHPEAMGLDLELGTPEPATRDLKRSEEWYSRADSLYAAVGATRGRAAVALRRAHLARVGGDTSARDEHLSLAAQLAEESTDQALLQIIHAHQLVDRLQDGKDVPPRAADDIADWAARVGSASLGRGLTRMVVAAAHQNAAASETLTALRALRLARAFAGKLNAPDEESISGRSYIELLDSINFRRASAVLLAAETAAAIKTAKRPDTDASAWLQAVREAMSFNAATTALSDPDLKALAIRLLNEVDDLSASVSRPAAFDELDTELIVLWARRASGGDPRHGARSRHNDSAGETGGPRRPGIRASRASMVSSASLRSGWFPRGSPSPPT
jgi:hypothetical protein